MPYHHQLGRIPPKRHTQFRQEDGTLYSEELFSTEGFSNEYSLLYHVNPPTAIIEAEKPVDVSPKIVTECLLSHRSFEGFRVEACDDYLESQIPILVNNDVHIVLSSPKKSSDNYFYKNTDADEMIFVHRVVESYKLYTEKFHSIMEIILLSLAVLFIRSISIVTTTDY